jgi:hypothetical protein
MGIELRRLLLVLGLGIAIVGGCAVPDGPTNDGPIASLAIDPATVLGDGWEATDSLVLDGWSELSRLNAIQRPMVETVRNTLEPRGLLGLGSLGFGRTQPPLDSADLRLYRFRTVAEREAWTAEKYGYEGWEEHYQRVESPHLVLDSTQTNKRIVGIGPWWITSGALRPDGTHLVLLEHALERLGL